ncbi:MAG: hypothetical protein ACE5HC_01250 [Candidatus Binatia bacterium]
MAKDLAVAVIHGMGTQHSDFAEDMMDELNDRIDESDRIAWQTIFWADVLQPKQNAYLRRANSKNDLDFFSLRKFVVGSVGDAAAYRRIDNDPGDTYGQIHTVVRDSIKKLYEENDKLDSQAKPLIILAHSLGGHIMSNYIWDIQKNRPIVPPGNNRFERMRTLALIITFGCNIPLFTFAYQQIVPIRLPPGAKWMNYFDPDDVLGYPLKPINQAYRRTVSADKTINVGGILSSWNPLSHIRYWTDNSFTKPVARLISRFL